MNITTRFVKKNCSIDGIFFSTLSRNKELSEKNLNIRTLVSFADNQLLTLSGVNLTV